MPSLVVPVLPKRVYNFSNIVTGVTVSVPIVERIAVAEYTSVAIVLRAHTATVTNGTLDFVLWPDGWTPQDPGLSFVIPSQIFAAAQISSSTVAPALYIYSGSLATAGEYVDLMVRATRTSGTLSAAVSVDLILRTPASS